VSDYGLTHLSSVKGARSPPPTGTEEAAHPGSSLSGPQATVSVGADAATAAASPPDSLSGRPKPVLMRLLLLLSWVTRSRGGGCQERSSSVVTTTRCAIAAASLLASISLCESVSSLTPSHPKITARDGGSVPPCRSRESSPRGDVASRRSLCGQKSIQ
jgi:hypothetical protein